MWHRRQHTGARRESWSPLASTRRRPSLTLMLTMLWRTSRRWWAPARPRAPSSVVLLLLLVLMLRMQVGELDLLPELASPANTSVAGGTGAETPSTPLSKVRLALMLMLLLLLLLLLIMVLVMLLVLLLIQIWHCPRRWPRRGPRRRSSRRRPRRVRRR